MKTARRYWVCEEELYTGKRIPRSYYKYVVMAKAHDAIVKELRNVLKEAYIDLRGNNTEMAMIRIDRTLGGKK